GVPPGVAADARDDRPQYVTLGYTPVPALSVRHRRRSRGEREGLKGVLMVAVVRPLLPKTDALAPAADAQSHDSVAQAAGRRGGTTRGGGSDRRYHRGTPC